METNGYYYFYELCKNGGFSSAAKALYVTQPAVSYAISKLEQQLGVKLIEKGAKKLTLTEYGEDLYRKISPSFDNLLQVDSYIQDWKQECLRPITIAVPEHIASILVIDKVIEFNKKYPDIKFNIIYTIYTCIHRYISAFRMPKQYKIRMLILISYFI